mmetsp:Transcript_67333/g.208302  ORF Transcript_67333/g.208302 Transcript_67333/m.208302 type:complete len:206 (-) Transcript_67333:198-815(-)
MPEAWRLSAMSLSKHGGQYVSSQAQGKRVVLSTGCKHKTQSSPVLLQWQSKHLWQMSYEAACKIVRSPLSHVQTGSVGGASLLHKSQTTESPRRPRKSSREARETDSALACPAPSERAGTRAEPAPETPPSCLRRSVLQRKLPHTHFGLSPASSLPWLRKRCTCTGRTCIASLSSVRSTYPPVLLLPPEAPFPGSSSREKTRPPS